MEKDDEIQGKYHKLATEYSKIRSQATVLKKAVLDEQTRNTDLNEQIKNLEQTVRIRGQEMESLLFRNEQLTKRIAVLQQELQMGSNFKKNKGKPNEVCCTKDSSLFNEEFQKKIFENAQLMNSVTEKDAEILEYKEKIKNSVYLMDNLKKELEYKSRSLQDEKEKYKKEKQELEKRIMELPYNSNKVTTGISDDVNFWQAEVEKWKLECSILKSKPKSDDQLTNYYESQLSKLLETNVMLQSETRTTWSENIALKSRLENITLEHNDLKNTLNISYEELKVTHNNYKTQLDAMTEHLAAQNEKITRQCDEIQFLKHKISSKK